jgi:hypothetical protein
MGTFAYGDSYYGLRSYDQTTGAVKDASATVTATSSISTVDWVVNIGSGQITLTATSSTTCSGESIIIERTDKFAYGTGLYGKNVYDQADLQTIVSATSSIASVSGVRVQNGSAISSASSSTTSDSEKIHQGVAVVTALVTTSANAVYTIIGAANVSCSSDITAVPTRIRSGGAVISTTSGTLAIGREKWEVIAPTSTTWTEIAA